MPGAHSGLTWLDYLAVVGYLLVTAGIIYWSSRKEEDTDDFFLGGRQMPWLAVGLSIMATLLSTNTYLGAPGEMIKNGPAYVIGYIAYPLLAVVVMSFWIPFFMRLRLTSAYEYLERRFDYRARLTGNLLFLGLRLGWMSMVVYTASLAMVRMVPGPLTTFSQWVGAPDPIYPVVVAVGLAATVYAFFGGMRAVIWTDVLQAVMLFGGVVLILVYVVWEHGTFVGTWWSEIAARSPGRSAVQFHVNDITERTTIVWAMMSIFFWNVCTHCSDQVALQRYFTVSSLTSARRSFLVNIASSVTIGLLLAFAGLALRYHYQLRPETLPPGLTPETGADQIMPHFYSTALPAGFGGLILVSFLCDAMQTLVSGVNSISAIITKDLADRSHPGPAGSGSGAGVGKGTAQSAADDMRRARVITVSVGLGSTLLAILAAVLVKTRGDTIFDMLPKMFNLFLGPLASMFIIGMFIRRARGRTVITAVLLTLACSFLWSWWTEVGDFLHAASRSGLPDLSQNWFGILGQNEVAGKLIPRRPTPMLAVAVPCLLGVSLGFLLSRLEKKSPHAGEDYTWREVMKRPVTLT